MCESISPLEHALELELAHFGFQSLRVALDIARGGLVALGLRRVPSSSAASAMPWVVRSMSPSSRGQARALASQLLRPLGILPDRRILELPADLFEPLFLVVVLKETPEESRCAPRGL